MELSGKGTVIGAGVVVVAGALVYLFQLHGYEDLMRRVKRTPSIELYSASRPTAKEFFVGEKIRFKLQDATAPKVFWLFDEQTWRAGEIEVEYAFEKPPVDPVGATMLRRVDAFVKPGDEYFTVNKLVTLYPSPFQGSLRKTESKVIFSAPMEVQGGWTIERVDLAGYEKGKYVKLGELTRQPSGMEPRGETTWVAEGKPPVMREIVQGVNGEWVERDATAIEYLMKASHGKSKVAIVKGFNP